MENFQRILQLKQIDMQMRWNFLSQGIRNASRYELVHNELIQFKVHFKDSLPSFCKIRLNKLINSFEMAVSYILFCLFLQNVVFRGLFIYNEEINRF